MSKGQAERLFPMIDAALSSTGQTYGDLNAIAVATGPGNFTGVRIGVSAARGLALSLGIPAIGVSVLEGLAFGHKGVVMASIDARGGTMYNQMFKDGKPISDPHHGKFGESINNTKGLQHCAGYRADELAATYGATSHDTTMPKPETYGLMALARNWADQPRPAPLYLRQADAALPSEPAPHILS